MTDSTGTDETTAQAHVFAFPMATENLRGRSLSDIIGSIFNDVESEIKQRMANEFPTGPVTIGRFDVEMIADAMVFYHAAFDALVNNQVAQEDEAGHKQYHATARKVAAILERMVTGDKTLTIDFDWS